MHGWTDWSKATADQISAYCSFFDEHMPAFPADLLFCCDPSCNWHYSGLDSHTVCVQLLECIKIGASLTLPVLTVCCFLTYSVVCLWSSNLCCPIQTKKNSKKRYKYEVRRLRRQREFKNRKRLGMALLCHPNKDFWKQVQNISAVVDASTV